MAVSRNAVVVKRRLIESHVPPTGGTFMRSAAVPALVTPLLSPYLGVHCVDTDERVAALSYDDGPHPVHTARILDLLAARGVHATFFVLAEPARRHPDLIRRIVSEGHELALHGHDHTSLLRIPHRESVDGVLRARDDVSAIGERDVTLFRPPYGHHTPRQAAALRREGLAVVIWSSAGLDWIDDSTERIADRAWGSVFPGAILLLHDDRADPETLLPGQRLPGFDKAALAADVLDRADSAGFDLTTVGGLLQGRRRVLSGSREKMLR